MFWIKKFLFLYADHHGRRQYADYKVNLGPRGGSYVKFFLPSDDDDPKKFSKVCQQAKVTEFKLMGVSRQHVCREIRKSK